MKRGTEVEKYPRELVVNAARRLYGDEGRIEIDDGAQISRTNDEQGQYIQAWVWVPDDEMRRKDEE